MDTPSADYDSPWKEIIERYFPEFMAFFFPDAYAAIDWSKGYTFLDKELQQVVRDAETGPRRVDKLAQVTQLGDGKEAWVLAHVEIQGEQERMFEERIYIYNYRLYDRYQRRIASLVVLTDTNPNWRPHQFAYELFGCRVALDFPVVKLLDYQERWAELEADSNPFAVVVMAQLQTLATRKNPNDRYAAKLNLAKMLYRRGYKRQDILELFRFIDWVMALPPEMEEQFMSDVVAYEAKEKKPYVTSIERIARQRGVEQGMQQGRQQGMQQGMQQGIREMLLETLQIRFGSVPETVREQLDDVEQIDELQTLHRLALTADSLTSFVDQLTV